MPKQALIHIRMSPKTRRVVYAVLYEIVAILGMGPVMAHLSGKPMLSALGFRLPFRALRWRGIMYLTPCSSVGKAARQTKTAPSCAAPCMAWVLKAGWFLYWFLLWRGG